ncbi:hypothetical protein T484DRAFT_1650518, partial [Baffinella frigidus]
NPQPSTLNPQPSTLNPQPSTLNPQPSTLNPDPLTLNSDPQNRIPKPKTPHPIGTGSTTSRVRRHSTSHCSLTWDRTRSPYSRPRSAGSNPTLIRGSLHEFRAIGCIMQMMNGKWARVPRNPRPFP